MFTQGRDIANFFAQFIDPTYTFASFLWEKQPLLFTMPRIIRASSSIHSSVWFLGGLWVALRPKNIVDWVSFRNKIDTNNCRDDYLLWNRCGHSTLWPNTSSILWIKPLKVFYALESYILVWIPTNVPWSLYHKQIDGDYRQIWVPHYSSWIDCIIICRMLFHSLGR